MGANEHLGKLRGICSGAELWSEGGKTAVFLPQLHFRAGDVSMTMDALLWPSARDGYPTRLFLERHVPGKGDNWNTFSVCGRTWHACSWTNVPEGLPWVEILANHLRAFQ